MCDFSRDTRWSVTELCAVYACVSCDVVCVYIQAYRSPWQHPTATKHNDETHNSDQHWMYNHMNTLFQISN